MEGLQSWHQDRIMSCTLDLGSETCQLGVEWILKLKLLPTIFLQRVSEEEGAREGEGVFSQTLGCLDVKDAFLRVRQEKPLKVNLEEKNSW